MSDDAGAHSALIGKLRQWAQAESFRFDGLICGDPPTLPDMPDAVLSALINEVLPREEPRCTPKVAAALRAAMTGEELVEFLRECMARRPRKPLGLAELLDALWDVEVRGSTNDRTLRNAQEARRRLGTNRPRGRPRR